MDALYPAGRPVTGISMAAGSDSYWSETTTGVALATMSTVRLLTMTPYVSLPTCTVRAATV